MLARFRWLIVLAALVASACGGSSSGTTRPQAAGGSARSTAPSMAPSTAPPSGQPAGPPKVTEVFTPLPCNANTTVGMEGCSEHRILRADAEVDRLVQLIWDNSTTAGQAHLADAETAWEAYRKAACISEADKYAGGTLAPVVAAQCSVRLTRARASELRRQLRFLTSN